MVGSYHILSEAPPGERYGPLDRDVMGDYQPCHCAQVNVIGESDAIRRGGSLG
jgi:hypothetical protein